MRAKSSIFFPSVFHNSSFLSLFFVFFFDWITQLKGSYLFLCNSWVKKNVTWKGRKSWYFLTGGQVTSREESWGVS